jgi:hypothetical protein
VNENCREFLNCHPLADAALDRAGFGLRGFSVLDYLSVLLVEAFGFRRL